MIACVSLVVWLICFLSLIKLAVSQPMNFSCFCPSNSLLYPADGGVSDCSGGLAASQSQPTHWHLQLISVTLKASCVCGAWVLSDKSYVCKE